MKKTFFKELFKTIKNSLVIFISISIFIVMGMALFLGIQWASDTAKNSGNAFMNKTNLYDVKLSITDGIKDIDELLSIEGVDEAEGAYFYTTSFKANNKGFETSIRSLTSKINTPYNIQGTLPKRKGEVAMLNYFAEQNDFKIGDKITIKNDPVVNDIKAFSVDTLTITALIDSSEFMSKSTTIFGISFDNMPVNSTLFVHKSSFNNVATNYLGYNLFFIKSNKLNDMHRFSDEYKEQCLVLKDNIENSSILKNKSYSASVSTNSMSHINIKTMDTILNKIKYSMAGLFVIVGFLVSYFSIYRLIEEQKIQIGTKKANGFSNKQIYLFYLSYILLAVLLGSIVGAIGARFICEPIIFNAIDGSMVFPDVLYFFSITGVLIFASLELLAHFIITLLSSHRVLKYSAIDLLKNENKVVSKQRFYQKGKLWNKFSLFFKTIINNIFNNRTRIISMLVGIGGCASLLVCALTIDRNISNSFIEQYKSIFTFQNVVYYDSDKNEGELLSTLDDKNYIHEEVMFTYLTIQTPDNSDLVCQTYIFDEDAKFDDFVKLHDKNNKPMDFSDGLYLSCSYQNYYEVEDDAKIKYIDSNFNQIEVNTKGFFKHYLVNNVIFMNSKTYEEIFNGTFKKNASLVNLMDSNNEQLNKDILHLDCVRYIYDMYHISHKSYNTITDIFKIVDLVYIILSVLMAFLVVLSLIVMFIKERKTELITLIVNGYSKNDAKKYIYFDTIIISFFALIIGVLFGTFMSKLSLSAFASETIYFINGFNLISSLIACSATILIVFLITILSLRHINNFKLTDVNKGN